jgi:hypothetical protein
MENTLVSPAITEKRIKDRYKKRSNFSFKKAENWMWRILFVVTCATLVLTSPPNIEVVSVSLTQDILDSPGSEEKLLRRAKSSSTKAMIIQADNLRPGPESVERWHAIMELVSESVPVAVALSGAVNLDTLAMLAPANQIFVTATGIIEAGVAAQEIDDLESATMVTISSLVSPSEITTAESRAGALRDQRITIYKNWIEHVFRTRARSIGQPQDVSVHDASVIASIASEGLSAQTAIKLGLVDSIGFGHDAVEWAMANAGVEKREIKIQHLVLRPF